MMKKCLSGLGVVVLSGLVVAQSIIGSISEVKGLVTVSDAATVSNVVLNAPVIDGTRYVTSSTGYVTLKLDRNCDVHLKPNQSLVVDQNLSCPALIALIQSTQDAAMAVLFGGGISNNTALQLIGTMTILALLGDGSSGTVPGVPGPGPGPGEPGPLPCPPISCE